MNNRPPVSCPVPKKALKKLLELAASIAPPPGESIIAGGESAEVRQFAAQMLFCKRADRLPLAIQNGTWEQLERYWKITRGSSVEEIFSSVSLPEGWILQPTSHNLWSELLDSCGSPRASIFYQTTGQECRAYSILSCRYVVKGKSRLAPGATMHQFRNRVLDMAEKQVIFATDWTSNYEYALNLPVEFLEVLYPEHRNPFAYWPD
jgi:hypothetical protein